MSEINLITMINLFEWGLALCIPYPRIRPSLQQSCHEVVAVTHGKVKHCVPMSVLWVVDTCPIGEEEINDLDHEVTPSRFSYAAFVMDQKCKCGLISIDTCIQRSPCFQ